MPDVLQAVEPPPVGFLLEGSIPLFPHLISVWFDTARIREATPPPIANLSSNLAIHLPTSECIDHFRRITKLGSKVGLSNNRDKRAEILSFKYLNI